MKCICVRCGKEFESKKKTLVCPDCGTTGVCVVCGKEFELKWPYTTKTCSRKCSGMLRKQSGQGKEIAKKSVETKKERYSDETVNVGLQPKKCAYCGKLFIPTSNRQKYCGDDYGNCPVCGKRIKIKDMYVGVQACSMECRQKLIEKTNEERYGVKNVFQSDKVKEKSKETNLDKYGKERYQSTDEFKEKYKETMNKKYGVNSPLQNEEIKEKWKQTNLNIYGTEYPSQNEDVKQKVKDTFEENYGGMGLASEEIADKVKSRNLNKYGVENSLQSSKIQNKIKDTNLERYGYENAMQNKEVQQKAKNTNLERYGVKYPLDSDIIRDKANVTIQEKYGVDNVFQSEKVKEKIKETNLEKYGVENPQQNEKIKKKTRKTNLERYGVESWKQSDEALKSTMTDPTKFTNFKKFKENVKGFIQDNFIEKPTLQQIADMTGVTISTISLYVLDNHCEDMVSYYASNIELEVEDFILSIIPDVNIIMHDRNQIKPLELDIYLPDYNFSIECDPTYTHNSTLPSFEDELPKSREYHKNKSIACEERGVFLFHIFGYEWTNKKDIILSMIRNILGKNDNVIYGRNTEIKEISQNELDEFLNQNHRQGTTTAKIRLGLIDKESGELVSVMAFSGLRNSIGKKENSDKKDMELSRFCSKLNTTVIGASSKLFKYFTENYDYNKIVSFSDVAHTRGTMYENLGFKKISTSKPSYVWVELMTDRELNRVSCQKRNLRKLFNEPDLDINNKSESEIMVEHGFVKVYDCGVIRWEYE